VSDTRITAVTSVIKYPFVFVLAVAAECALAGGEDLQEIGDQAADLPHDVLRELVTRSGDA
jgi:hypothetical protein